MQVQRRVALGDVTSQVNNRANRFGEFAGRKPYFEEVVQEPRASDDEADRDQDKENRDWRRASVEESKDVYAGAQRRGSIVRSVQGDAEESADEDADTDDEDELLEIRSDVDGSFLPLLPVVTEESRKVHEYVHQRLHREDPDPQDEDTWDPVMVSEYTIDIFQHLRFLEQKFAPNARYIESQPELTWSYRSTLIDWIVQVHDRLQLLPETLFLTVNIIDRFLSRKQVTLNRLQLVGAAALLIAAKYEEINCPTLKDMLYMLDNAYSKEELLRAETFMINTLGFEFGWPGPMSFLRRVSKADDYEYDTRTVAKYLLETSIMEPELVAAPPSWLAAGAYYLSKIIIGLTGWSDEHIYYSGYTEEQLLPLATMILDACRNPVERHKSILEKYSKNRHRKSAFVVAKWISMAESRLEQKV